MKKQILSSFMAGVIIGAVVFGSSIALAWSGAITVDFQPLNFFFNGVQKYPASDQQGFIYNGRTYVPLRFMAEASGLSVEWDGNSKSIYVGGGAPSLNPSINTGQKYMSDILEPYYDELGDLNINENEKVGGKTYYQGYSMSPWNFNKSAKVSFNLSGQYSRITGLIGLSDNDNNDGCTVLVYGDDNLIETYELAAGSLPERLDLNVSGVTKLDFILKYPWPDRVVLCDPIIQ